MWLLKQSIISAFRQLKVERFRTLLSLVGVCVGIFSIVAVLTVVDSMKRVLTDSFDDFGNDVVMIEQIPLEPDLNEDGFFRWWEYVSRPQVSYSEYRYLENNDEISGIAFCQYSSAVTSSGGKEFKDGEVVGVEGDWLLALRGVIEAGRGFSATELNAGDAVTVIGNSVANELFGSPAEAVGQSVNIGSISATVIGVFQKMGVNQFSLTDIDAVKVIPFKVSSGIQSGDTRSSIIAAPDEGLSKDDFNSFLRDRMRIVRALGPDEDDDFALNRISFLEDEVNEIFSLINILGWIVGCFSLLIGGFGISNIMFVAVRERTSQIGIMKALGAKKKVILTQFLVESVVLSLLGALTGILFVEVGVLVVNNMTQTSMTLTELGGDMLILPFENIITGVVLSLAIGIVSGMAPAVKAANLQPSVAMTGVN